MRGFRIAAVAALWLGASALQLNETSECFGIVPELKDDAGVAAETGGGCLPCLLGVLCLIGSAPLAKRAVCCDMCDR